MRSKVFYHTEEEGNRSLYKQIKIGCLLYGDVIPTYRKIEQELPSDIKLIYSDGVFSETIQFIEEFENTHSIDVFISSGWNAQLAKAHTSLPVIEIKPSGFDILNSINEAVKTEECNGIGIITYQTKLDLPANVNSLFPVPLFEKNYVTMDDVERELTQLKSEGINHVIGGAYACTVAKKLGMYTYDIISSDSIRNGINQAIEVATARIKEIERAVQWQSILEFAHEGIVATDNCGNITVFNQSAEKITGVDRSHAIGKKASDILNDSRLEKVLLNKKSELNRIQDLNTTKVITNRIPLVVNEDIIGSLATFQTIDEISKAEHIIRHNLYDAGFVARNSFTDMIGKSEEYLRVKKKAKKYATSSSSVLFTRQSGYFL